MDGQLPLFAAAHERAVTVDLPAEPAGVAALSMCVLGSGSGGNSTVLRLGDRAVLVDAGFGPLTTARRLKEAGLQLGQIGAICLTHLDQDHFRPTWVGTLLKSHVAVYLHRRHWQDLRQWPEGPRLWRAGVVRLFEDAPFAPLDGFTFSPIRLPHDTKGTCGFRVHTTGGSIGYATDLGHVSDAVIDHFTGVDALAIESNYDPHLQRSSGRPVFLQRRIMGRQGHLSNEQSFAAVQAIVDRSSLHHPGLPRHIVLLHRSQQCNCPTIVESVFKQDPSIAGRVTMTDQGKCTQWLEVTAGA